jgi:hypothetical protein
VRHAAHIPDTCNRSALRSPVALPAQSAALAEKPMRAEEYLGNGFPSGPHHNLILNGKKTDGSFTCPEEDREGGNVIFMPRETSEPAGREQILIESGRKGPKSAPETTGLVVTDACTTGLDGDAASFKLLADPEGYWVGAVVHGKPIVNGNPADFHVLSSSLNLVEVIDADGTPVKLLTLGLITP